MAFGLDAYLARIGYRGPVAPTREALFALHQAHATAIPFENLDIQMGLPIRLDLDALQEKLVSRRRGGYCFEQNTLFRAALQAFGFAPRMREARVSGDAYAVPPRTHGVHILEVEGSEWLVDVGFGGEGPIHPVRLDGREQVQFQSVYRAIPKDRRLVLQNLRHGRWSDLYAVEPEEAFPIDWEVGNFFTSAHPGSRFIATLTVQRPLPEVRHILRGNIYTMIRADREETRELRTRGEFQTLLRGVFGIDLPAGTRFRALDLPDA